MKTVNPKRSPARTLLHATPVAAAVAALLSTAAYAQTAPVAETITVTGIRRGIESAISVKKNADSIVEAISAEDIGKLPDSSIAESIARLPGLTAQRVAGRASQINIRGLSGDFSTALLNGREQASPGDNRGVEFDQYPSELLSGVTIYKTPDGALLGQGLSGTIDLQTVRPLSFGGRAVVVNLRGQKEGVGTPFTGKGTRFNISYIDQFADRTIGVALGFARLKSNITVARSETYDSSSDFTLNGTTIKVNNGFKYFNDSTEQTRDGAAATFEFKPSKDFSTVLDLFYSKFDKDVIKRGLEIQVNDSWKIGNAAVGFQAPSLDPGAVVTGGRLISGTWNNVNPLSRHIWEPVRDEIQSIGWNSKLKFSPSWSGTADLSNSTAKRLERITEMEAGVYDTANRRPLPEKVTVGNFNEITRLQYDHGDTGIVRLTDPESWGQNGYDKVFTTKDTINALRLSATTELEGVVSRVEFGVNLSDRKKTKSSVEQFLRLPGGSSSSGALPAGTGSVAVGNFRTISFNPEDVFPSSYNLVPNVNGDILAKGWEVKEKVNTAFVKAAIDTEVAGLSLRGNVGLQAVNTDQNSTAPSLDNANQGSFSLVTRGKTYTDVLPSLNLNLDLGSSQVLKLGVARTLARARMDQLSAFQRTEFNNGKFSGSGGNPLLDPFRANAFDLSYEKYFGNKGYVSAAVFYKQLKSYIFDFKDLNFDFKNLPDLKGVPGIPPNTFIGEYSQPRNGKGGKINGVELAASLPLNMMTDVLDGFGVQVSYSNTSSAIKPFGDSDTRSLPGLSKQVSSITAYYENYGFSFRVAQRQRSDFLGEIQGFGGNRDLGKYIKAESVVDLQLGYEFQTGFAKGLSLLLQINNAGNAKYEEYTDPATKQITKSDQYGKTYLFGATYKF
jgi:iron complex outermembrane recepter protein